MPYERHSSFVALAHRAADEKPIEPKLPLGKETTFVTGPLDKHGYIDYEEALNAEIGKGITPERNANALFVLVFGPTPQGGELPPAYYKWLDIPAPSEGRPVLPRFLQIQPGQPCA